MSKFEKISILKTGEIVKKKKMVIFALSVFPDFSLGRSQKHLIFLEEYICYLKCLC